MAFEDSDAVDEDRERALRRDRGIQLPQRAGRGVPCVRSGLASGGELRVVEAREAGEREVDLPSNLGAQRRRLALHRAHPQRDRLDRTEVRGHVLAALAVSARRAPDEHAVLVDQRDRGAVDLRLEHVRDGLVRAEPLADVVGPLLERLARRHLLERAHRREVLHLPEAVRRRRADALGRRVGRDELRVRLLERGQLVEERVVGAVGDLGVVEDVVAVVVVLDQTPELGDARRRRSRPRGHARAPAGF